MPAMYEVGTTAGSVAAGDDSRITGAAQKASNLSDLASASTALATLGGVAYATAPGYSLLYDLGASVSSTASETSLLSGGAAIAGTYPLPVHVGDAYRIQVSGTMTNTTTGTLKTTIIPYFGLFPIFSIQTPALSASATARLWGMDIMVMVEVVGAAGTGKIRVLGSRWGLDTSFAVGAGWNGAAANVIAYNDGASSGTSSSPALVTNAAQAFNITATNSTNASTITTTMTQCRVSYHPTNH